MINFVIGIAFLFGSSILGIYTVDSYNIGTMSDPGPAAGPVVVLFGMFLLGIVEIFSSIKQPDIKVEIVKPAMVVCLSIAAFYLTYIQAGLFLAVTCALLISMSINKNQSWVEKITTIAVVNVLVFIIFELLLKASS